MTYDNNLIYQIGLTLVHGIGNATAKRIIDNLEDVSLLFTEKKRILELFPGFPRRIIDEIHKPSVLKEAEKEIAFIEKWRIIPLFIKNPDYPQLMKECVDAPVMLYYRGSANLNARKIISIVGTRKATDYGLSVTNQLLHDLSIKLPDLLVVSGLAFGIDVIAHRAAIRENLTTVGVLAHGLDRIYPPAHRNTAAKMLENGGLITDFVSATNPDRQNFVKRNRIIAGMANCTIIVESAAKGGALITANLVGSYNRDLFAFPGRVHDRYSEGCNMLIKQKQADIITSADDLLEKMNWDNLSSKPATKPIQKNLFIDLNEEEKTIAEALSKAGPMQFNTMSIELNIPIGKLSNLLIGLELNGVIRSKPGGIYELL
ncbi:MAG: DNA-processing protein DprA [Dysgonamonadaceae bacterium]|nr:DNA-processing protein DprA [Dysgonamonadaceae bacterium]